MRYKIANVLLEESRPFRQEPLMYVRCSGAVKPVDGGTWELEEAGTYDFTTFFNGLSVMKYRRYTVAKSFAVHLEVRGAAVTFEQTHVDAYDLEPERTEGTAIRVEATDEWYEIDVPLATGEHDVLCSFALDCEGAVQLRNAYFMAEVEDAHLRDVELVLGTTTFKKEAYIHRNIALIKRQILQSGEEIADHFQMHVIDNGRTLDVEALSGDGVTVHPNDNVGGSGGFAYAMLCAMDANATHVLLMDDDVEVSPESIKRTYALLRIVNDEYAEAFVSGAMMNYGQPDMRWEDLGFMSFNGAYTSVKPHLHMNFLREVVGNETFSPNLETYPDIAQTYAAWWYCCIPLSMIRKNGMPLPFFVRFDDAEYGMRSHPKFMTMNGICIWHEAFHVRYNGAVERYQTMRNGLIGQATTGVAPMTDFLVEIEHSFKLEICKFNYTDAELVLEAMEDYLKGPDNFAQKGFAERRFMDANRNKEHMRSLAQVRDEALERFGIDIYDYDSEQIERPVPLPRYEHKAGNYLAQVAYNHSHKIWGEDLDDCYEAALSGKIRDDRRALDSNVAVIHGVGWSDQYGLIYGREHFIAVVPEMKIAEIRDRDLGRAQMLKARFDKDLAECKSRHDELVAAYGAARERLTSVEYWRDYLNL